MSSNKSEILRLRHVLSRLALSRSTIYAYIEKDNFPRPIKLGPRAVGWLSADIDAWLEQRIAGSKNRLETRSSSE